MINRYRQSTKANLPPPPLHFLASISGSSAPWLDSRGRDHTIEIAVCFFHLAKTGTTYPLGDSAGAHVFEKVDAVGCWQIAGLIG